MNEIAYSNQNNSATMSKLTFQAASTGKPMNCQSWLPWCWVACHSFDLSPKTSDNYALLILFLLLRLYLTRSRDSLRPITVKKIFTGPDRPGQSNAQYADPRSCSFSVFKFENNIFEVKNCVKLFLDLFCDNGRKWKILQNINRKERVQLNSKRRRR